MRIFETTIAALCTVLGIFAVAIAVDHNDWFGCFSFSVIMLAAHTWLHCCLTNRILFSDIRRYPNLKEKDHNNEY